MPNENGEDGGRSIAKKERSPSFPFIGLTRAAERAQQLFASARRSEVRLADAAAAWGLQAKSSATLQTIAALLAYGLIESNGSGEGRKVKISELGRKLLEDQRPGANEMAYLEAALKPKLIAEYAQTPWSTPEGRPADNIRVSELTIDRGFTDDAARNFLRVFDDTMQYVIGKARDNIADSQSEKEGKPADTHKATPSKTGPKVGDYIQWTSNGIDMFPVPERVTWASKDGAWLRVASSQTGIPTNEAQILEAPQLDKTPPPAFSTLGVAQENDIKVLMDGSRLRINASVDRKGLRRLRKILESHAILMEDEDDEETDK